MTPEERRKLIEAPITVGILATIQQTSSSGMAGGCVGPSLDVAKLPVYNLHTGRHSGRLTNPGGYKS